LNKKTKINQLTFSFFFFFFFFVSFSEASSLTSIERWLFSVGTVKQGLFYVIIKCTTNVWRKWSSKYISSL